MTLHVSLIAAVASNGVIGNGDQIPWHIPSDFAWFKRTTMGKPMVMGRKQFEIFGKPLPGRPHIVVTRNTAYVPAGVTVCHTLDEALAQARAMAVAEGGEEVMVVGGGDIYRQAIAMANRLYISHVDLEPAGDVFFPPIDPAVWSVVAEPSVEPSDRDDAAYQIKVYERQGAAAH